MPKFPKILYEAVSDYITPHMTLQLSWTAARTTDFRTVQTVSLFGPTATSNRLNVTGPLWAAVLWRWHFLVDEIFLYGALFIRRQNRHLQRDGT